MQALVCRSIPSLPLPLASVHWRQCCHDSRPYIFIIKAEIHSCQGILVNINGGITFMKSIYRQRIALDVDIPSAGQINITRRSELWP